MAGIKGVKASNTEKVAEWIKEAEGRATTRTITAQDVQAWLASVEKKLGISKKSLLGVVVDIDINAQNFPNAYKYTPESTHFCAVYKKNGWKITYIGRCATRRSTQSIRVRHTEESKRALIDRFTQF